MKKVLFFALALLCVSAAFGQKKTFVRDYIYQASEADSKQTARAAAMQQMQILLLQEVGQALQSEQTLRKLSVTKDGKETFSESFSQEVMAITAGFVEMKILDESWNGKTYYIEARMTVDPKEVSQKVAEILSNKQKENPQQTAQSVDNDKNAPKTTAAAGKLYNIGTNIYAKPVPFPFTILQDNTKSERKKRREFKKAVGNLTRKEELELRNFLNDNLLNKADVRSVMQRNPEALRLYDKGVKQRATAQRLVKSGNTTMLVGLGAALAGLSAVAAAPSNSSTTTDNNSGATTTKNNTTANNPTVTIGGVFFLSGLVCITAGRCLVLFGPPLAMKADKNVIKAVDTYNNGLDYNNKLRKKTSAELRFGVTPSGVGLALNF